MEAAKKIILISFMEADEMLTSFQSYSLGIKFKEMNIDENKNKKQLRKQKYREMLILIHTK